MIVLLARPGALDELLQADEPKRLVHRGLSRRLLGSSDGRCGGGVTLLGGAEHQGLVDVTKPSSLGLSSLQPRLQLLLGHLEVANVGGRCEPHVNSSITGRIKPLDLRTPIQKGNFA